MSPTASGARIEDHALLSDQRGAALVTREGDVDWLCLPRFDDEALFASLLGRPEHGRWSLRIADGEVLSRRYLPGTMILETLWRGPAGTATVTELMPLRGADSHSGAAPDVTTDPDDCAQLIRSVVCTSGEVEVRSELRIRFEYGHATPWMRRGHDTAGQEVLLAVAGGDGVCLHGPGLQADGRLHRGRHILREGDRADWVLTWFPSWEAPPAAPDVPAITARTSDRWSAWLGKVQVPEEYAGPVERALLVLRALTHRDSGGIIAAATTSLPEDVGGVRNWDYRYCWLRDAALSLEVLLAHGHVGAAVSWREWLLRAVAGDPENLQIMYTVSGDRELVERELPHLPGFEDSAPVRIGNGAAAQYQADVVGEVMIALAAMREAGVEESAWSWPLQRALVRFTVAHVDTPDQGIWEMRGEPAFFTHGRAMVWATFDRAITAVERDGCPADPAELETWRSLRERVRAEILERGVGPDGAFTQSYGSTEVDASALQIPRTGLVAADDPRMLATVDRLEAELMTAPTAVPDDSAASAGAASGPAGGAAAEGGLLLRYRTRGQDGLPGDEHPFLVCSFWLVEQYAATGRTKDAERLLETLLACGNDLDLFAEEYDVTAGRMAGNFPQAFSHLGLVRAVDALAAARA